ncbi:MAG: hypothetical protein ACT4QG_05115 [Sporichthyaceae bacterium]
MPRRAADGTTTTITGVTMDDLVLTPTVVAWTGRDDTELNLGQSTVQMWVFDRRSGTLYRLPGDPNVADVHAAGSWVAWREENAWRVTQL